MMKKRFLSCALLTAVSSLFLTAATVQAQYQIEFTDGRLMTVRSYKEEGQTITVYMSSGSVAFQKADIKQIVGPGEQPRVQHAQPPKTASLLDRYQPENAAASMPEADGAPSTVEKTSGPRRTAQEPTPTEKLQDALQQVELGDMLWSVADRLYQLRYIAGLLVFGKLLKMLLLASAK